MSESSLNILSVFVLCSLGVSVSHKIEKAPSKEARVNTPTAGVSGSGSSGRGHLVLSVRSSDEAAILTTNFTETVMGISTTHAAGDGDSSINSTYLGLYIVIIHQSTGRMMGGAQHFQPWSDLRRVQTFLHTVQPGRIIVFMLWGDLSYGLPGETRAFLRGQGSCAAPGVIGRGLSWAWVWVKGGRTLAEAVTIPTSGRPAHGLLLQVHLPLTPQTEPCTEWPSTRHWRLRRLFCERYEQYGDLCSCTNPNHFTQTRAKIANNQIEKAVIIVVAHRVPALYKSLKTVIAAVGFSRRRVEVFTPSPHPELARFLRLAGLPLTVTRKESPFLATLISKQFVFAINYVLDKYRDADFVIFLEEDISVSPDFFVFLNRSASVLREDPSLHCASAHNDLSYPHTSYDPRAVLRAESYTNYGWMVTRDFAQEMASELAGLEQLEYDWDVYTYFFLRRGRECIIPEVSRSHHFGDGGSHISQLTVRLYFSDKNFNLDPNTLVEGVEGLAQDRYEEHLDRLLQKAQFVDARQTDPCQDDFGSSFSATENDVLVLFFHVEEDLRFFRVNEEWAALASCLGTFAIESREGHHGLYRLRHGPAHLLLVAYPASPYSRYKPVNVTEFRVTNEIREAAYRRSGEGRLKKKEYDLRPLQKQYDRLAHAGQVSDS